MENGLDDTALSPAKNSAEKFVLEKNTPTTGMEIETKDIASNNEALAAKTTENRDADAENREMEIDNRDTDVENVEVSFL